MEAVGESLLGGHEISEAVVEGVSMESVCAAVTHPLVDGNPLVDWDPLVNWDPLVEDVSGRGIGRGQAFAGVKVTEPIVESVRVESICCHFGIPLGHVSQS